MTSKSSVQVFKLLLLVMSECVVLLQLGSVLMSIAHVSTEAHVNHMLNHVLKYKGRTELPLPLNGLGRATYSSLKS